MKKTLLSSFLLIAATGFAASNSYKVNIYQNSVIEGKTVKAGEYKVTLENGNAVLKQGKDMIEVPAHEVMGDVKVASNELVYQDNTNLKSIEIGGTNKKIVFEGAGSAQSGM